MIASGTVGELPAIAGPDDWFAMTSRLRVVLEDPRQLLSGAVTDYAGRSSSTHDNDAVRGHRAGARRRALPRHRSETFASHRKENHHESACSTLPGRG